MNLQRLTEIANKFKKNRNTLQNVEKAIEEINKLQLHFDYSKRTIETLEVLREDAHKKELDFPDENYEVSKEKFEKGEYELAHTTGLIGIEDMENLLELVDKALT